MEITFQIDSLRQQRMHLLDDGFDGPGTNAVITVRHSVLQNINRLLETGEMLHRMAQALRINLAVGNFNAGVALGLMRRDRNLYEESL